MKKFLLSFLLMFLLSTPVLAVDEVEPNDDFPFAQLLDLSSGRVNISGILSHEGDADYYHLVANEATQFKVRIKNTGGYKIHTYAGNLNPGEENEKILETAFQGKKYFYVTAYNRPDGSVYKNPYEVEVIVYPRSRKDINEPLNDKSETAPVIEFTNSVWKSGEAYLTDVYDADHYRFSHDQTTQFKIKIKNTGKYKIKTYVGNLAAGEEKEKIFMRSGTGSFYFYIVGHENAVGTIYENTYEAEVREYKRDRKGVYEPQNHFEETAPVIEFTNSVWKSGEAYLTDVHDADHYRSSYEETTQFKIKIKNTGKYKIKTYVGNLVPGEEKEKTFTRYGTGSFYFYIVGSEGAVGTIYENTYQVIVQRSVTEEFPDIDFEDVNINEVTDKKPEEEAIDPVKKQKRTMKFKDIKTENKFYNAVDYVYANGIVDGYEDETFKTENAINRAEFTKIIMTSSSFENQIETCNNDSYAFPDTKGTWMAKYVCVAKENGIIKGYDNGQFKPGKTIQLSEALKIMFKVYSIDAGDTQPGDAWFTPYYRTAENNNLLAGVEKNAAKELTRGEAVQLIYNMRGYIEK
ncbi:hypothetical protein COB57_01395 [Candidatus Peregrinibacteria bacterium]|nr:MAG: hypothetical protein COB57_01395 [Candidatus Peregrinibacteria bacterium]